MTNGALVIVLLTCWPVVLGLVLIGASSVLVLIGHDRE